MTTFPPAPLLWQNKLALDNTHSQIAYVGYEGTIFHLSGPFAPVLGAQSGVALQQITNLDPSFKHLDNKGARQDGTTWYDSLYDPGEIALSIKLGGSTASDMRKIISSWLGAWQPTQVGKLCWYSPERGEWFANVRQAKNVVDKFEHDWYQSKEVTFTWIARNDNAFWQGVDSVCSFGNAQSVLNDSFTSSHSGGLEDTWAQLDTGPGVVATPDGDGAEWEASGTTTGTAICQYIGSGGVSQTDDQYITITFDGPIPAGVNAVQTVAVNATGGLWSLGYAGQQTVPIAYGASAATVQLALELLSSIGFNNVSVTGGPSSYQVTFLGMLGSQVITTLATFQNLTGGAETVTATTTTAGYGAYVDLWGRMNNTGTTGDDGVRARIGYGHLHLSIFSGGTQHDVWNGACPKPVAGDSWSLQCGVNSPLQQTLEELFLGANWTPNQYQVYQNGTPLIPGGFTGTVGQWFGLDFGYIDQNNYGQVGSNFRGEGFGMVAPGTGTGQLSPPKIGSFVGGQGSGNFTLTNIGDQPAWPRYLCYGPGTFLISDGYTGNLISFGPLEAGQVALLNTMPRLQPVVDLTPGSPTQTTLTKSQALVETMINYATNSNVPPLLQAWESQFGIQPPQGPLTALLNGRFTQPLAPMLEQEGAKPTYLYCQIQGGNSDSKVVAAVTPYRRWPE